MRFKLQPEETNYDVALTDLHVAISRVVVHKIPSAAGILCQVVAKWRPYLNHLRILTIQGRWRNHEKRLSDSLNQCKQMRGYVYRDKSAVHQEQTVPVEL